MNEANHRIHHRDAPNHDGFMESTAQGLKGSRDQQGIEKWCMKLGEPPQPHR